jgi:hypothetical protein
MVESKRMVGIVSAGRVVAGYVGHAGGLESSTGSVISRHENGPGRIYTAVRSSKAAKTTTGEVIKQEKVVKEGSCGVLPHLYAHGEAAKKAPLFLSTSYHLRFRYDFEAKDLVRGSSLPGRLFKKYYITSLMLAPCYRAGR